MVRKGCSEEETLGWDLRAKKEPALLSSWGRMFQAEGTASIKALSWKRAWYIWRTEKRKCVSGWRVIEGRERKFGAGGEFLGSPGSRGGRDVGYALPGRVHCRSLLLALAESKQPFPFSQATSALPSFHCKVYSPTSAPPLLRGLMVSFWALPPIDIHLFIHSHIYSLIHHCNFLIMGKYPPVKGKPFYSRCLAYWLAYGSHVINIVLIMNQERAETGPLYKAKRCLFSK